MNRRLKAYMLALLASPVMLVGFAAATDAGNSVFSPAASSGGKTSMLAPARPITPASKKIGGVTRTKASVEGALGDRRRDLQRDLPVFQNEEVTTGNNARAALRFRDGSVLSIGADAEVVLDEYVYGNTGGVITLLKGAMRFTSGKMGRPGLKIQMPVATIGIRGTDFWAGEIDDGFGVLLMHGIVDVSNEAGTVTLTKRSEGTLIAAADEAPSEPTIWKDGQQEKALAGVSFRNGPLCAMLQRVAKNMFRSCI